MYRVYLASSCPQFSEDTVYGLAPVQFSNYPTYWILWACMVWFVGLPDFGPGVAWTALIRRRRSGLVGAFGFGLGSVDVGLGLQIVCFAFQKL